MRHVVGDLGHEDLGLHARHRAALLRIVSARLSNSRRSLLVILLQVELERHQHAEHLFLVHLHAPADGVAVRRRVQARGRDEILSPSSRPALCGPRMPLPPENATRSKPILVYFHRFSTGGTSAAASLSVGIRASSRAAANSSS